MAAPRPKVPLIAKPHISSFDYALGECLSELKQHLHPLELEGPPDSTFTTYKLWIEELYLSGKPTKTSSGELLDHRLLPAECRMRGLTYSVPLVAKFGRQIDSGKIDQFTQSLGAVPVMLKSEHCHLSDMSHQEQIQAGEDYHELGGTFIVNGLEKLIRLVIMPKRNYPMAMMRGAFVGRGPLFTPLAVQSRCVRKDLYTQTVTLHYLSDGNCMLRFLVRRAEFLIPAIVMLKALLDATDQEVFGELVRGRSGQIATRVQVMLASARQYNVATRMEALAFMGSKFRVVLGPPGYVSDVDVGHLLLNDFVFVHLEESVHKHAYLLLMLQKLYALAEGEIQPDNSDVLSNHELLLPGQVYLNLLREKLEDFFDSVKQRLIKESSKTRALDLEVLKRIIDQQANLGKKMEFFLATGNLITRTGLDLMQTSGFTIVAEKINYARYISHFRSVHRGQYFTEVKMTAVRKLMPDSWGFMCPVHTPDGAPCGLLNHLANACDPLTEDENVNLPEFIKFCCSLGMQVSNGLSDSLHTTPIVLNGRVLGHCSDSSRMESELRAAKIAGAILPPKTEIAHLPRLEEKKQVLFPGIFIFTTGSRFVRPVMNLVVGKEEFIGPLEQLHLSIAAGDTDLRSDTTHQELSQINILSILASNVPFCDCNQSPRNMYQCQMAKQTMGTAIYNYPRRSDTKLYRLVTPQRPIVSSKDDVNLDFGLQDYPSGTNAVVAVLSFTGYDMEDAMIVNKAAYERGFAHGYVYKTNQRQLNEKDNQFRFVSRKEFQQPHKGGPSTSLDVDGLPHIGAPFKAGDPELCLFDQIQDTVRTFNYKDNEPSKVERVTLFGSETNPKEVNVHLTYRFPRNPIIGDKFSSRHGQKGVLSVLWPQEDMPFSESGITPDIIINPNAFPSRMTIGMLIESLAGKSGALHGFFQDSTPFQRYYDDSPVNYFGEQLLKAGFNFYGTESMYSGIFGTELKADIYLGIVYYQRLRHMVSDKYQARSTGPIDILTHQPVKGRKHHGGIRLGEMERDSLLAHGVAFLLHDRLMHCSDYSEGYCCPKCGSILTSFLAKGKEQAICKVCQVPATKVSLPFVLRYLSNELAAMNITMEFVPT